MIHRQETVGVFGVPFYRFIDIDDSEAVLRAIRQTPPDAPIDLLLHTPGGLVLASEQIAYAVRSHPGKVTVLVPHYAMSGGTLIALAADEIVMDEAAVLGPVDPQLGDMPAAALVRVVGKKPVERLDDRTLLLADIAEKALRHMKQVVRGAPGGAARGRAGRDDRGGAGRRPLHPRRPDHRRGGEGARAPGHHRAPERGLRPDGALSAGGTAAAERPVRAASGPAAPIPHTARRSVLDGPRAGICVRMATATESRSFCSSRPRAPAPDGAWRASWRRSRTGSATACASPRWTSTPRRKLCEPARRARGPDARSPRRRQAGRPPRGPRERARDRAPAGRAPPGRQSGPQSRRVVPAELAWCGLNQ